MRSATFAALVWAAGAAGAAGVAAGAEPSAAGEAGCSTHTLSLETVKEQVKRWPELMAFNRWRIVELSVQPCVEDDGVPASLLIEAPEGWSEKGIAYRVRLPLRVDGASGAPLGRLNSGWTRLSAGGRVFLRGAEGREEVRGFLERYPPLQGDLTLTAAGKRQITWTGHASEGRWVAGSPFLVFVENTPGRLVAYRVPTLDGLPVRRELLRFAEILSERHPRCFPTWLEGRLGNALEDAASSWSLEAALTGEGCPSCASATIAADGSVAEVPEPASE